MDAATHAAFKDIVLGGARKDKGMGSFADILTPEDCRRHPQLPDRRANEDWGFNRDSH